MSIQPTHALQQFEDRKADPRVQALTSFILLRLGRRLGQVHVWNIDVTQKEVTFRLEFTDGCQIEGTIERLEEWVFREAEPRYRWIVSDDWRCVF